MGSIISARCECGYKKEEMFIGGGFCHDNINFPHYCLECKILFEANLYDKKILCPECGTSNIIAYDNTKAYKTKENDLFTWNAEDEIGRKLLLTDGKYICPGCGKYSLKFYDDGCWD